MKKTIITFMLLFTFANIYSNIRFIIYRAIPNFEKYENKINFVFNNEHYMDTWSPEWKYEIDKNDLIEQLKIFHDELKVELENNSDNIELCLFLGDISHFLYNLDKNVFYDLANNYYDQATDIESRDFRSYWFKGFHLIQSNKLIEGMKLFLYTEKALPADRMPSYFWIEYCISAYQSQMFFNSFRAFNNVMNTRKNNEGENLKSIINSLKDKIVLPEIDINYQNIWKVLNNENSNYTTLLNYLFGIKYTIPEDWEYKYSDSNQGQTVILIKPNSYVGYDEVPVSSSILSIIKAVPDAITFDSFIQTFLKEEYIVTEEKLNLNLYNVRSFSIKSESLYPAQGGGHMYLIAIERPKIDEPGIKIEEPVSFNSAKEGLSCYTLKTLNTRYNTRIFYVFFLDACESIFEQAYADYFNFITNNIVIE